MIVCYANGGGLGHLQRCKRFLDHAYKNDWLSGEYRVITNHPSANQFFHPATILVSPYTDKERYTAWLQNTFDELSPSRLITDCFPAGILGELNQIDWSAKPQFWHLARYVDYDIYGSKASGQQVMQRTFVFEDLHEQQASYLRRYSSELVPLNYPDLIVKVKEQLPPHTWLVVHTEEGECQQLLELAKRDAQELSSEPNLVVWQGNHEDAVNYFDAAERVYSGAGFNTWYEMSALRAKHHYMAFDRKYGDQKWRVSSAEIG